MRRGGEKAARESDVILENLGVDTEYGNTIPEPQQLYFAPGIGHEGMR